MAAGVKLLFFHQARAPGVDGEGQGRQVFQGPGLALLAGGVPGQTVRGVGLGL